MGATVTGADLAAILVAGAGIVSAIGGGIAWLTKWVREINAKLDACEIRDNDRQRDLSTVSMACGLLIEEICILAPGGKNTTLRRVGTMLKATYAPPDTTPSWTNILAALETVDRGHLARLDDPK